MRKIVRNSFVACILSLLLIGCHNQSAKSKEVASIPSTPKTTTSDSIQNNDTANYAGNINDQGSNNRLASSYCGDGPDCRSSQYESICKSVKLLAVPTADLPTQTDKKELTDCDPATMYGIYGDTPDYVKARKCALMQYSDEQGATLGANEILEMIYANGYGVKQNMKLAIKFACNNQDVDNIMQALTTESFDKDNPFKVCDYFYGQGGDPNGNTMCNNLIPAQVDENSRQSQYQQVIKNWSKEEQQGFNQLFNASESYIDQYVNKEIDLSVYADRRIFDTTDDMEGDFFDKFESVVNGQFPSYSQAQFVDLDKQLNQLYKQIIDTPNRDGSGGTMCGDVSRLKDVQRSWIVYKDAWVNFAKIRYPNVNPDNFKAWLTTDRISDLNEYLNDCLYSVDPSNN